MGVKRGLAHYTGWQAGLKKTFGPMKEEAAAEWRKLHTEEFHSFYSSPNIIPTIAKKRI